MSKSLNPPQSKLDSEWNVNADDQVQTALEWLAWMDATEDHVNATIAAEVQQIKDRYKSMFEIGEKTFADLRTHLTEQITAYCKANRKNLLKDQDGKKTRPFPGVGSVSWANQKSQIQAIGKSPLSYCLKAFVNLIALNQALDDWMSNQKIWLDFEGMLHRSPSHRLAKDQEEIEPDESFGVIELSHLISLKREYNKNDINESVEKQRLTPDQLKQLRLKVHTPPEKFTIKPQGWNVHSESTEEKAA